MRRLLHGSMTRGTMGPDKLNQLRNFRMDIQARLQEAVAAHQSGDLDTAAPIYKEILAHDPEQADALHFAGLLSHQKGDDDQGIDLIKRSLKVFPGNAGAHNNLGNIY